MAAVVRRLGSRPIISVLENAEQLGVSPRDIEELEASMAEAATWIRSRELLGGNEPLIELLAIAGALGAVVAQDHEEPMQLAILLAYRLITAADQMKEQP